MMQPDDTLRPGNPADNAGFIPEQMPEAEWPGETAAPPKLEQCVPVAAVSVPDEGEQLAEPQPGDTVRYEVEGKVTRTEGGHVYVMPNTINGQPVDGAAEAPAPADDLAGITAAAGDVGYL